MLVTDEDTGIPIDLTGSDLTWMMKRLPTDADPVAIPSAVPAPSITFGALTLAPDPVAIGTAVPTPSVTLAGVITPDPVSITLAVPVPDITLGIFTLTPATITVLVAVPAPSITVGAGPKVIVMEPRALSEMVTASPERMTGH